MSRAHRVCALQSSCYITYYNCTTFKKYIISLSSCNVCTLCLIYCVKILSSGSYSPPTVTNRICRALFGRYGDMIYGVIKLLTFVTVTGVMLALTVYYFDIKVDLEHMEITSNTS